MGHSIADSEVTFAVKRDASDALASRERLLTVDN